MGEEFNVNDVVANIVNEQLTSFVDILVKAGKKVTNKAKIQYRKSLKTYVESIYDRHNLSRSFFYKDTPVDLYKFYVPAGIETSQIRISDANATQIFPKHSKIIIQGLGGCGKSVLLRHLTLDILKCGNKIPVFVELRDVNKTQNNLDELILSSLGEFSNGLDVTDLHNCIESGLFAFLFDGFDELDFSVRDTIKSRIKEISLSTGDNWMVLTSRPDNELYGWSGFVNFNISPLTLEKALALLKLVPFDRAIKSKFIKELGSRLFAMHESFLSNPLLLSIMLITFHNSADVPKKLNVFYSQAYEALFQRHDAWKGGYKRDKKTNLDIHDFGRVFACFSMIAYRKRVFSFSRIDAITMIKKSIEITKVDVKSDDYLNEAMQAVCLLIEDALEISYTHRSFQEYFVAKFIADAPEVMKNNLMSSISENLVQDGVISLLHEMQPDFVEIHYILPILEKLFSEIGLHKEKVTKTVFLKYIKTIFNEIVIGEEGPAGHHNVNSIYRGVCFFTIRNSSYLLNGVPTLKYNKDSESIFAERIKESGDLRYYTKDLKTNSEVINYLYENGCYLGPKVLSVSWLIYQEILKKKLVTEKPIHELLSC